MNRRDTRILGFGILAIVAISIIALLTGCVSNEPVRRAVAAPAVDTTAITGQLSRAQIKTLSARQRAERERQLLEEEGKLIKMFP